MMQSTNRPLSKLPVAIDLFSGCGGLTVGLKRAGFTVLAAVELDSLASQTYRSNHPEVHLVENDIRKVVGKDILKQIGIKVGKLDVLAGCPPCQGFSTLRTMNNKKASKDDRNDLILEFLRLVEEIKPRSVMLENVPGLAVDRKFSRFTKRLEELGYKGVQGTLDVSHYGVPQRRNRLILHMLKHTKKTSNSAGRLRHVLRFLRMVA